MSFTKIASTYPIWLPPRPREGKPGEWINLANVETLVFNQAKGVYVLRFTSGLSRLLPADQATVINEEFRQLVRERRSPAPTKKTNKPT